MTVFPVIVRELRAQSRQPLTYWLRVLAAGAVVAVLSILLLRFMKWGGVLISGRGVVRSGPISSGMGALLFGYLNATLLACNCVLAPLLTADCISREKREGTLGLLFLTKLSAIGIVTGKGFAHALRGLTLFVAMLPVLGVPVLLGGVSAKDCAMAFLIDSIVLLLGLSAGLLASALCRDWVRSACLAVSLSTGFLLAFMFAHAATVNNLAAASRFRVFHHHSSFVSQVVDILGFHVNFGQVSSFRTPLQGSWGTTWSDLWSGLSASAHFEWFRAVVVYVGAAFVLLLVAIVVAALHVRSAWRQQPRNARITEVENSLTRPRFAIGFLRRRLSRTLERNPIGWLHQYSWKARLTKWVSFAAIMAIESLLVADPWDFASAQPWVFLLFLLGLAFAAAGSFRNERESGALELLLVCPLRINQIIAGRLRGIWMQSLPSALLLALCVSVAAQIAREGYDRTASYAMMIAAVFSVPMLGLFFSMCRLNFLAAWIFTVLFGIFVPFVFLSTGILGLLSMADSQVPALIAFELATGVLCWTLLSYRLRTRRFTFTYA